MATLVGGTTGDGVLVTGRTVVLIMIWSCGQIGVTGDGVQPCSCDICLIVELKVALKVCFQLSARAMITINRLTITIQNNLSRCLFPSFLQTLVTEQ